MPFRFNPFTGNLDEVDTSAAAGSDTQVQFNNGGSLAGSADLTWDDTGKELGVGGDINLDDGGTYATTLQLITPTANRTISFPDATGTVGLVAGSSGQLIYNNAGAYAGAPSTSVGATGNIALSLAGAASTPPVSLTGTWFSGGTSTTTKPQLLIEPVGTTSTAWSTSGTGLGVNAASGFAGNLLDLQLNGSSKLYVNKDGNIAVPAGSQSAPSLTFTGDTNTGIYSPGADQVAISTNGTGRLFIDSSGRLGLGTSSPSGKLDIVTGTTGNVLIDAEGGSNFHAKIVNDSGDLHLGSRSTSADTYLVSNRRLYLRTGPSESNAVYVSETGNVGVGTTSPSYLLDVRRSSAGDVVAFTGSTDGGRALKFASADNGIFLGAQWTRDIGSGGGIHAWAINGTERARFDSSGRLLVGTSSARSFFTGYTPSLQLEAPTAGAACVSIATTASSVGGPVLFLAHSRGANGLLNNADDLGTINFNGGDGTDLLSIGAQIRAVVDGTPGADDMPGRLVFSTTADGASSPTEQLRITSDRYVRLASGSGGIQFNGDTAAANALDDYEEGTWTPVVADAASGGNTGTFATNYSWYRKIGNTVFVFAEVYDIDTTGLTAGNTFWVRNLPFNISPGKVFAGWGSVAPLASQTSLGIPFANSFLSTTGYRISYCKSSTTGSALVSDLTSGTTDLFGGLTYYV